MSQLSMLDYECTIQLVHKDSGDRSGALSGTMRYLQGLLKKFFCETEGQNPDDHVVLVLTQHIPDGEVTKIIVSQLPMITVAQFITVEDVKKEQENV